MAIKSIPNVIVDLQTVCSVRKDLPNEADFKQWIVATLTHIGYSNTDTEITIRIVDNEEIQGLNRNYRGKDKPTNVLSFPFDANGLPEEVVADNTFLGDIIIAPDVLIDEADVQGKLLRAHWTHMTVHGVLHLLGYDHETDAEAQEMEALEVRILAYLDIKNPYKLRND